MIVVEPQLLTGGEAVAHAFCQIEPDVFPVYPITPQTPIIQTFSSLVADGAAHTEIVNVESEHSAMSAAIGSALAGARTATATSSQGLALMAEVVFIAASMRAPIVMAVGNRALSGPINIHCDHSDSMLVRDAGVLQLFAENAQEAYDLTVMAPRIAEHPDVLLPVLVCQDGFTITHAAEPVELLADDAVRAFVGPYRLAQPLLDVAHPASHGPFAMPDYYFEFRRAQAAALDKAAVVIASVADEFEQLSGRSNHAYETYRLDDARRAMVALGSSAGTIKDASTSCGRRATAPACSSCGRSVPSRRTHVARLLGDVAEVIVLDRADSPGGAPPLAADVAFALRERPAHVRSHVYGLGGRDLHPSDVRALFDVPASRYVGVRGDECPV